MSRALPEWIGRNDDAAIPPRVRLRIFNRHEGRCYISGRKITPGDLWELDHIVPLCLGGEHRETNLAPALRDKHREKTRADVAEKSRSYSRRLSHAGVKRRKHVMPGSKASGWRKRMDGTVERRDRGRT